MLFESLLPFLTPQFCEHFDKNHYAIFPLDAVPEAVSDALLQDVTYAFENIACIPNEVEFQLPSGPIKLTKPNIYECDMHREEDRKRVPHIQSLFDSEIHSLAKAFQQRMSSLEDLVVPSTAKEASQCTTVKLQKNCGGSFPWHYDNPQRPNKRRLTMAVYLMPDWSEKCGGELLLQPFLKERVVVPPRKCTVALFRSDSMLHAVRPIVSGSHTRYCFTIWFDRTSTNGDDDVNLKEKHLQMSALPLLQSTPLQRVLSRCVYDEEYRQSLADCFGMNTRDTKISIALHEAHVKQLIANPKIAAFVNELQEAKKNIKQQKLS